MNDEQNILPALQHIALMAGLNHDCKLLTGKQVAANVLQRNGGEHGEAAVVTKDCLAPVLVGSEPCTPTPAPQHTHPANPTALRRPRQPYSPDNHLHQR